VSTESGDRTATAVAPANIAFVKYWGNRDARLHLPLNDSLSMNLSRCTTTTCVTFTPSLTRDVFSLDGEVQAPPAVERVAHHLSRIRAMASATVKARVESWNTFPLATGIAASASGFAALTLAACGALGLELSLRRLSRLARLGSGSAARSIPDGFVRWFAGPTDDESFAESIAPPSHWDLCDLVAVVDTRPKVVSSAQGHAAALTSPFMETRLRHLDARLEVMSRALLECDLAALGVELEAEAISLHVIAMTSRPPILYWRPATLALIEAVRRWRGDGLPVYFTLDAGPNVHVICPAEHRDECQKLLTEFEFVHQVIANQPVQGARLQPASRRHAP
jgi:diphosphomevalonate decarboxylase